jgi:hypothetical protein
MFHIKRKHDGKKRKSIKNFECMETTFEASQDATNISGKQNLTL